MGVKITHRVNQKQLQFIISSPLGPVAKDLLKRGARVQTRARRNLGGTTGTGPKRVDTGVLRASINSQLEIHGDNLAVRVGTGVPYAIYVHDGTGIYGPKRQLIRPKSGKVLVFASKQYGAKRGKFKGKVVVAYVRGMKPNPFLREALPAAKLP